MKTVTAHYSKDDKIYVVKFQITDDWTIQIVLETVIREVNHLYGFDAKWNDPIRLEISQEVA